MTKSLGKLMIILSGLIGLVLVIGLYFIRSEREQKKSAGPEPAVLFESSTEKETTGYAVPDDDLVATLVKALPDVEEFLQICLDEKKGDASDFKGYLVAYPVMERDGKSLYFVRPTLEPYCSTLYGAHAFKFWFLQRDAGKNPSKYRLVLDSGADIAEVVASVHHGQNDIKTQYCVADGCEVRIFHFNGYAYWAAENYFEKNTMADK